MTTSGCQPAGRCKLVSFFQNYDYNSYDEFGGHTGDPNQDAEFNRQQYTMPDKVKNFLIYFRNHVNEGLVFELQTLYEMSWPKLTEDYFEKRPWPEQSDVLKIVGADSEVSWLFHLPSFLMSATFWLTLLRVSFTCSPPSLSLPLTICFTS